MLFILYLYWFILTIKEIHWTFSGNSNMYHVLFSTFAQDINLSSKIINSLSELPLNESNIWPIVVMSTKGRMSNGLNACGLAIALRKKFSTGFYGVTDKVHSLVLNLVEINDIPIFTRSFMSDTALLHSYHEPDYMTDDLCTFLLPLIQEAIESALINKTKVVLEIEAFDYQLLGQHASEIRKGIHVRNAHVAKAETFLQQISHQKNVSRNLIVGFHVRRQDYEVISRVFLRHELPSTKYYENSINFFRKRLRHPVFVVVTDDWRHAKKAFSIYPDIIILRETLSPEDDFALLLATKHKILTVGSFGFWSTFLNGGDAVYPIYTHMTTLSYAPKWKLVNYEDENFQNFYGIPV